MIKKGDVFTCINRAQISVLKLDQDGAVSLSLRGPVSPTAAYFWREDIKELRKWLKKLQRQLEQGDSTS